MFIVEKELNENTEFDLKRLNWILLLFQSRPSWNRQSEVDVRGELAVCDVRDVLN